MNKNELEEIERAIRVARLQKHLDALVPDLDWERLGEEVPKLSTETLDAILSLIEEAEGDV